jgi:erythromycin esterase
VNRHRLPASALLAATLALPLHAQSVPDPRVAWLAAHAVPLRSIDPGDDDFRDLEPLRKTLAGVRVVMLGEQSHGDGTTFLAKGRLVRFLHEKMGFDVLAFESGFYDCAKAWDLVVAGEAPQKVLPRAIYPIWTRSREGQPVFDYLVAQMKSSRPLELAGVDSQFGESADLLLPDLAAFLSRIDPKLAEGAEWKRVEYAIRHLDDGSWEASQEPVPPAQEQAAFAQTVERWRALIAKHDNAPATQPWSSSFWRLYLTNLRVHAEQTWRTTDFRNVAGNPVVYAMRDRQMGKNVVWLANERYPKRKIIVWAATLHNARRPGTIETSDPKLARLYAGLTPMGEVAWKELGDELYSLGFISFEGESATDFAIATKPLPRPSAGSLEDLFARAGLVNAFVDFRHPPTGGRWLRTPIGAQVFGHREMRGDWTRVVDGVIFLRSMQRSHKVAAN